MAGGPQDGAEWVLAKVLPEGHVRQPVLAKSRKLKR
jgi:hypothetical protein